MEPSEIKLVNKEGPKAKGIHIISVCNMKSARAKRLQGKIEDVCRQRQYIIKNKLSTPELLKELWMEYHWYLEQLHRRFLVKQLYVENVTTTVGRSVFAQILGGDTTYTGVVNYGALGTDNTAPDVADTILGTETYRKALSSGTDLANQTFLENFYTATEVSGNFEEYGFFIDGTGAADSGQLFNRFTQTVTKSVTESLNIQSIITWNDN